MSLNSVVLPEPDGPTIAVMVRGGAVNETSRTTGVPGTYENVAFCTETSPGFVSSADEDGTGSSSAFRISCTSRRGTRELSVLTKKFTVSCRLRMNRKAIPINTTVATGSREPLRDSCTVTIITATTVSCALIPPIASPAIATHCETRLRLSHSRTADNKGSYSVLRPAERRALWQLAYSTIRPASSCSLPLFISWLFFSSLLDTSVKATITAKAIPRVRPRTGFQIETPTRRVRAVSVLRMTGTVKCASPEPTDRSPSVTRREIRPFTPPVNQPSGSFASWSPTLIRRRRRASNAARYELNVIAYVVTAPTTASTASVMSQPLSPIPQVGFPVAIVPAVGIITKYTKPSITPATIISVSDRLS